MESASDETTTMMMENDGQSSIMIDDTAGCCDDDDDDDDDGFVVPDDDGTENENKPKEGTVISGDESSNTITIIKSSNKDDDVVVEETKTIASSDWSDVLKSPTDIYVFSPSLDPNKPENLNGFGLRLALDRSKDTDRFCKEIMTFLTAVATTYEQLSLGLLRTSQPIRPQNRRPFQTRIDKDLQSLYDTNTTLAAEHRSLSESYRSTIVSRLPKILTNHAMEIEAANSQYKDARLASWTARQTAIGRYTTYDNAVRVAETEIQEFLEEQPSDGDMVDGPTESERNSNISEGLVAGPAVAAAGDSVPSWEKALRRLGNGDRDRMDRLVQKLKAVQTSQIEYERGVSQENEAVKVAQGMEVNALRRVQRIEEERIDLFTLSVINTVFRRESDSDRVVTATTTPSRLVDSDSSVAEGLEKKGKEFLATLFNKQSLPYEEGMGVMDAETLNLPEEIGLLRDKVKSTFSAREKRIKTSEIVIRVVVEMADIASKTTAALKSRADPTGSGKQKGIVVSEGTVLGAKIGDMWDKIVSTVEDEATFFAQLASKVHGLRETKLESWLASADRNLKTEMDLDDSAWKHVCDAARTELRIESRYKQTKQQMDKARERVSSVDQLSTSGSGDSVDGVQPTTPNRDRMSRALFMGSEAVKKLQEKALVKIAKSTLGEVEQKEEKEQIALEESVSAKRRAIAAYQSNTTERINRIESEDTAGWNELTVIVNGVIASTNAFKEARSHALEHLVSQEIGISIPSQPFQAEEWLKVARERILQIVQSPISDEDKTEKEYSLTIKTARMTNVQKLLEMNGLELSLPEMTKIGRVEDRFFHTANSKNFDSSTDIVDLSLLSHASVASQNLKGTVLGPVGLASTNGDPKSTELRTDTQTIKDFEKQFWSDKPENLKPPEILHVISCSYRPKDKAAFLMPPIHGKLYTTKEGMYFLASEKNLGMKWKKVVSIQKEKGFMGASNENAIVVTHGSRNSNSSFTLGHLEGRDTVLSHLQNLLNESMATASPIVSEMARSENTEQVLPPVPPDALLQSMEVVVSKTIKNTSIEALFQKIWADGSPDQVSFYDKWLQEEECFDINVPAWEFSKPGLEIRNAWCNETYTQRRFVTFRFNRTTHLYIGPPVAFVKQQQYCRVEGSDKCVMAISASFEGIPYSDAFGVEMRWVARRKGSNDIQVEVGLFVLFKQNTMLKNQIKSGTISETKNVHLRLFDAVKKACSHPTETEAEGGTDVELDDEEVKSEAETATPSKRGLSWLQRIFSISLSDSSTVTLVVGGICTLIFFSRFSLITTNGDSQTDFRRLESRIDELQDDVRALKLSMEIMIELLKEKKG